MSIEAIHPIQTTSIIEGVRTAQGLPTPGDQFPRPYEAKQRDDDGDRVELSDTGRQRAARTDSEKSGEKQEKIIPSQRKANATGSPEEKTVASGQDPNGVDEAEAADEEQAKADDEQVDKLRARDQEVRAHEAAHLAVAGSYAQGGAHFDYQAGPDGKRYAVGGHVNIDTSPISGDPHATIQKAEQVRRAALAPAEPSSKDRQVAAKAAALIAKTQASLNSEAIDSEVAPQDTEGNEQGKEKAVDRPSAEASPAPIRHDFERTQDYNQSGQGRQAYETVGLSLIA